MSDEENTNPLGLNDEGLREALAELRTLLASGLSDDEASLEMGLTVGQYETLKTALYAQDGAKLRGRKTEEIYLDYCMQQRTVIKDLTAAYERFKSSNQSNAMVGALRARSDIIDKMMKFGQELGLIEKRPERKEVIAGLAVAELSDDKLRGLILGELQGVGNLIEQFGEQSIVDIPTQQTHYALPSKGNGKSKTNRAVANKVHGGRRVVKEPPA